MIRLHGLRVKEESDPDGDIEICYSGLRPGEKLHEEFREVAIFRDTRLGHPSRRRERKIGDMPCLRRPPRPAAATTRHFAGSPWLPHMALRRARLPYVLSQPAIRLRTSTKRTALTATRGSSHYASLHVLLECPSLNELLGTAQKTQKTARWLNCMGDFVKTQGWDYPATTIADLYFYEYEERWYHLGNYGVPVQDRPNHSFGDNVYTSLDYYRNVIDQPIRATPEDIAYALHRATSCFASSGNNHCGDQAVPKPDRFVWFKRLKSEYPSTPWAIKQKYYW